MTRDLYTVRGGIKIPCDGKEKSTQHSITRLPLPAQLIIPLRQNYGIPPKCIVKAGQHVKKGEMLATPNDVISAPVHAPTSGTIVAIEDHLIPHPSGLPDRCVVLDPDGQDEAVSLPILDWQTAEWEPLRQAIRNAGIVGLGGAVFPADVKINPPTEILIINGAECEPYITCDDMLMRERAEEIVQGSLILKRASGANCVMIGIESDKPEAISAMRLAVNAIDPAEKVTVHTIPSRYPSGYAKQLIYLLTGITIPADVLPFERGVQCFNVATTYSVYKAIVKGEPQISRILTVTGNVTAPQNYEVLIGTPIEYVLSFSQPKEDTDAIVMGGPMMGFPLSSLSMPVIKASACLLATSPTLFPRKGEILPCIRCGACVSVCPVALSPFLLAGYARAKRFEEAEKFHLFDCIECGCCSYVCPSNIPLVHFFKYAKAEIREDRSEQQAAEAAKFHFEKKKERLEAKERERSERLAKRAAPATTTDKPVTHTEDIPTNTNQQAEIEAALQRIKERRLAKERKQ